MRKRKSSRPKPIPLLKMKPGKEEEAGSRQLQLVTTSPFTFRLPDDWSVEERRRPVSTGSNPGRIDKYYIEPGTGLKFRSLPAVQRYLTEGTIDTRTMKLKPGSECIMQITAHTSKSASSFILPDGWEVEEKPRKNSRHIDKTYIELGTGRRFRSLISVERYLTEENENTPLNALMPANKSMHQPSSRRKKSLGEIRFQKVGSCSRNRNISGENGRPSKLKFGTPPAKVKWVLSATRGGNMWNPFVDDSGVPDSAKQKWSETFISTICGKVKLL